MKAAFINGSPRGEQGISAFLLQRLEERLPGCEIFQGWNEPCDAQGIIDAKGNVDAFVISFPLYVDGIPSNLLRELAEHEQGLPPGARVYVIAHNGFYEGAQNAVAIAMMRNWCARAKLAWGQGLGLGAGEILHFVPAPMAAALKGNSSLKKLGRALDTLAGHILAGDGGEDIFTKPDFPRAPYMLGGNVSFRLQGKRNGLTKREMERRL